MDWLNRLKVAQEATPDTIQNFPISPETTLPKLPKVFNRENLFDLLRDRQCEIDSLGDWTGCREWLNDQDKLLAKTRQTTKAIDAAFQALDADRVTHAIETHCQTWRQVFDGYHASLSPPVPKGFGIWKLADLCTGTDSVRDRNTCYCCKGTDYWLAGTVKYPNWVCRRCHPPAPGAERKPSNTPVLPGIGE